jgi:hypothetical protein
MAWRKWIVRSLVFAITGTLAAALFAYQHWTNPAMVRQLVLERFAEHLTGATVSLESARVKLLGGIEFWELRLARRDDPNKVDFAYVPSGAIFHDKEQLVNRKLVIRKIEWYHPRLRVIRREDGTWNLEDILAPPDLNVPVPTIELQNATIQLEDRYAGRNLPTLEIKNVNITILNDPAPLNLKFEGTGTSDLAGVVQVNGSWNRQSREFHFSVSAPSFAIGGALVQRLAAYHPEAAIHARQLSGTGRLAAEFHYRPHLDQPWSHDVRWQLSQGKLTHAELPFPLENLEAKIRCVDGQITVDDFKAQAGPAQIRLTAKALSLSSETDFETHVSVAHLRFSHELLARLPANVREIEHDYNPQGNFSMTLSLRRRSGQFYEHCTIHPERMTCVCAKFPYLLEQVTGTIDHKSDPFSLPTPIERFEIKLEGYSNERPVHIEGTIEGKRPAGVDLRIWGDNIPVDDKLCAALERKFQDIVHSFSPSGLADIEAHIYRRQGTDAFANRYVARFHGASLRYDIFPYPMENVTGVLDIQPGHWEFRDFQGSHKGGRFRSRGSSTPQGTGNHLQVEISGEKIALDPELEAALTKQPVLKTAWKKLAPSGRMDFTAHVDQLPGQTTPEISVSVTPLGAAIHPEFFPCDLIDVRGLVEYRKNEVKLKKLSARHGLTMLTLQEGKVYLNPNADVSVDLIDLSSNYIVLDAEMRQALPPALAKACAALQLNDPVSVRTDMSINVPGDHSPPYIYWDGGLRFKDATLNAGLKLEHVSGLISCRGQHQGNFGKVLGNIQWEEATILHQPFRDIHSQIIVGEKEPDVLQLPNLRARVFDGDLGGQVRVEFGGTPRYEVNLHASQIRLEEFGRHNRLNPDAKLEGLAAARVFLQGQGTDLNGVEGEGSFDVPTGKMYNLPVLLALLKFLNLRSPDRTAFDEAHVRYAIHGPRLEITRLDLLGNAISFGGKGTVNLETNDIDMDLYAVWARVVQVSPPLIKELWPALGKSLLKIKMKGRIGQEPRFEKKLIPAVVEPIQDLMRGSPRSEQGG